MVWFFWLSLVVSNWGDFVGQLLPSRERFDLLNASFYLNNLMNERHRYFFSNFALTTLTRSGFWLLIAGVPAAALWLNARAVSRRDPKALWLLVPCVIFPVLFALLIQIKTFNYLVSIAPLFAILLAQGLCRLLAARRRLWRLPTLMILVL